MLRDSVDVLVDKKYAIEVKIPDNRIALENLFCFQFFDGDK